MMKTLLIAFGCLLLAGVLIRFADPGPPSISALPQLANDPAPKTREQVSEQHRDAGATDPAPVVRPTLRVDREVAATELPLELLGTMVGEPASLSKAAILDTSNDRTMIVRIGETIEAHPTVSVTAIEPRRVLLRTQSGIQVLFLSRSSSGDGTEPDREPQALSFASGSKPLASTVQLARNRGSGISEELYEAMERMALNFANDLEPAYDSSGDIDGLRAAHITDGGLLKEAGVTREDVIQGVNGVKINDAEGAKRVLRDLANCQPMTGMISGPDGEREVEFTVEMLKKFDCVP